MTYIDNLCTGHLLAWTNKGGNSNHVIVLVLIKMCKIGGIWGGGGGVCVNYANFRCFLVKFPQIKVYTDVENTFRNMCTSLSILNDLYSTGKKDVEKLIFAIF